jgi:hypothetical protein
MIKDIPRSVIIKKMVAGERTCTADATPFKSPLYYLSYPAILIAPHINLGCHPRKKIISDLFQKINKIFSEMSFSRKIYPNFVF